MSVSASPSPYRARIDLLDVVRGIALCGIAFPNATAMWGLSSRFDKENQLADLLEVFFHQRFFPIFSLLFGIGFGMLWVIAQERTPHPRVALVRRMIFLLILGIGHQFLQPGEALAPYSVVGLLLLIPLTFLPSRWLTVVSFGLGTVLLAVSILIGGGIASIPGLFALGFAFALVDLPRRMEASSKLSLIGLAVTAPMGVLACLWHVDQLQKYREALAAIGLEALGKGAAAPSETRLQMVAAGAGIVMAIGFVFVTAALMHTPLRKILVGIFAPMGRMSLTNYIMATVLFLLLHANVGLSSNGGNIVEVFAGSDLGTVKAWNAAFALIAAVLALQWVFSFVWIHVFHRKQGPLELLWRKFTWWS